MSDNNDGDTRRIMVDQEPYGSDFTKSDPEPLSETKGFADNSKPYKSNYPEEIAANEIGTVKVEKLTSEPASRNINPDRELKFKLNEEQSKTLMEIGNNPNFKAVNLDTNGYAPNNNAVKLGEETNVDINCSPNISGATECSVEMTVSPQQFKNINTHGARVDIDR